MMEHIPGYDEWKTTPPADPEAKAYCDICGCPLFDGEYLTTIDGENWCDDCLNNEHRRIL